MIGAVSQNSYVQAVIVADDVRKDVDVTNDFLLLFNKVTEVASHFFQVQALEPLVQTFRHVIEFNYARSWVGSVKQLITLEDYHTEKDIVLLISRSFGLIADVCCTTRWIHSLGFLGDWVVQEIGMVGIFQKAISFGIPGIQLCTNIISSALGALHDGISLNEEEVTTKRVFSLAKNVSRVAAGFFIMAHAPLCMVAASMATIAICSLSIAEFFIDERERLGIVAV